MKLTDEQKQQADQLGLTDREMDVVVGSRMAPETYLRRKQEIEGEPDAWEANMAELDAWAAEHARRRHGP
jgi:hypothetical protein